MHSGPLWTLAADALRAPLGTVLKLCHSSFTTASGGPSLAGSVAYCSQVPWIMAASLRDNITFGQELQGGRYKQVLAACALEQDIRDLPGGGHVCRARQWCNLRCDLWLDQNLS
jgi:hypothetical protein